MKKIFTLTCFLFFSLATVASAQQGRERQRDRDPIDAVNPYMGNISHLLVPTYPTVHLPNSMLRMYPDRSDFTDGYLNSLPLTIRSHRGGAVLKIKPFSGNGQTPSIHARYRYDLEAIKPYHYSVLLEDEYTQVDFTPSHQSALYSLRFEKEGNRNIIFTSRDGAISVNGNTVSGYEALGNNTRVYFYAQLNVTPTAAGSIDQNNHFDPEQNKASGNPASVMLRFEQPILPQEELESIAISYGISYISIDQAKKNLEREIKDFSIDECSKQARDTWNKALDRIKVRGGTRNDRVSFYTSLYRVYERMINISEDGKYFSPMDKQVHDDNGIPFFVDDWIWDTYRATHPLRVLIDPETESAMLTSFIRMGEQSKEGWIPTFPEITGDAHVMNGNHAVASIYDAYVKGLRGFDLEKAYTLCKRSIMEETMLPWVRGNANELDAFYKERGYFPALHPDEKETVSAVHGFEKRQSVAVTLAASYDDWCLAQMAKALGKMDDYRYFLERSHNYRNLYNPKTGFFHPKDKDGNFIEPFDYRFSGGIGARDYYDENNGWIYRWDVPHNVADLIALMGGNKAFIENLDRTYDEGLGKSKWQFYAQLPDQTGNVGQFSMGNEPSLHIPYLYNYAGAPWKTQKRIRSLLEMWFRNDLMGVPGDEDGGGLSAFVVFSAIGLYPVTPGSPSYNIGSPLFEKIEVDLGNGKTFIITAKNCSRTNKYVAAAKLNGKVWNQPWIPHDALKNGGSLELEMSARPNTGWGSDATAVPPSAETFNSSNQ